jgi:hypothetical protein
MPARCIWAADEKERRQKNGNHQNLQQKEKPVVEFI